MVLHMRDPETLELERFPHIGGVIIGKSSAFPFMP
jgi:hypothetical protein